jgi:hypothetical protein
MGKGGFCDGGALLASIDPLFEAHELPRSPGSVFGGLTVVTSTAVPRGCALLYSEPTAEQQLEMTGMTLLERAAYMHRKGKAKLMRFEEEPRG